MARPENEMIDCSHISQANIDEANRCMSQLFTANMAELLDAYQNAMSDSKLACESGDKVWCRKAYNAQKDAKKSVDKMSRQQNRSWRTCVRQDPRNVCFRQKAMQSMYISAPEVMKEVGEIFKSGFDAKTKNKALDTMTKDGVSKSDQEMILRFFQQGSQSGSSNYNWDGKSSEAQMRRGRYADAGGGSSSSGGWGGKGGGDLGALLPIGAAAVVLFLILRK